MGCGDCHLQGVSIGDADHQRRDGQPEHSLRHAQRDSLWNRQRPGPIYPANGETVTVTINGANQNATISGGVGGFSVVFPTATIPVTGSPFTITYAYAGDANLNPAANNTSTTLTVTKTTPTISGVTASQSIPYGTPSVTLTGTVSAWVLVTRPTARRSLSPSMELIKTQRFPAVWVDFRSFSPRRLCQ